LLANNKLDHDSQIEDRVTPDRVTAFTTQLIARVSPVSASMMIGALGRMFAVLSPETDWAWMRRLYQDLKAWAKPSRDKRQSVVPAKDLYDLGIMLMDTAEVEGRDPYLAATQYRDGLLIAFLSARPVRMRNLTSIILGEHLVQDGDVYWLRFTADETKNGTEIDVPIPADLCQRIDVYLTQHRPVLLSRRKDGTPKTLALWVSRWGEAMTEHAIRDQIKLRTKAAFGHVVWPHLFRDCAATSMAIQSPENVQMAAGLLGHNTFATTEKYYVMAQTLEAGQQYQQTILDLREATENNEEDA
jgi:site-specific recombinase XerD